MKVSEASRVLSIFWNSGQTDRVALRSKIVQFRFHLEPVDHRTSSAFWSGRDLLLRSGDEDTDMSFPQDNSYEPWPPLSYPDFAATQHLLHMGLQAVGKLKLKEPFEPQWAEVPLWLSGRGLTTGPIPSSTGAYEVTVDLISHQVGCATSWGLSGHYDLASMFVAEFVEQLFNILGKAGINATINLKPQEVPNAIPFDNDTVRRPYDPKMVNLGGESF
jgi:hypothetical protein